MQYFPKRLMPYVVFGMSAIALLAACGGKAENRTTEISGTLDCSAARREYKGPDFGADYTLRIHRALMEGGDRSNIADSPTFKTPPDGTITYSMKLKKGVPAEEAARFFARALNAAPGCTIPVKGKVP